MTPAGHEMLLSRKLKTVSLSACHNIKQNSKSRDAFLPLMSFNHFLLGAFLGHLMKVTMSELNSDGAMTWSRCCLSPGQACECLDGWDKMFDGALPTLLFHVHMYHTALRKIFHFLI